MGRLEERVVVITGAGRGIGEAFARRCASEGARVVIAEILVEPAERTAESIRGDGGEALAIATDVTSWPSVEAMANRVLERYARIDVLVNNAALFAGIPRRPAFESIPEDEWDRVIAVNVKGVWLCCRAVAPTMRRQRYGKIVNMSSDVILSGVPGLLHYSASKGAVFALTRALARELGQDGICVNAIAPGFTTTEAALEHGQEAAERSVRQRAIQRPEVPDDLTGTLVYLASDDSDFVTGQLIAANGGYVLH